MNSSSNPISWYGEVLNLENVISVELLMNYKNATSGTMTENIYIPADEIQYQSLSTRAIMEVVVGTTLWVIQSPEMVILTHGIWYYQWTPREISWSRGEIPSLFL